MFILRHIKTLAYFFLATVLYSLRIRAVSKKLYWSGRDLVAKPEGSFRIPKQAYSDMLYLLRMLNTVRYKLFAAPRLQYVKLHDGDTVLFDEVKTEDRQERIDFIAAMTGAEPAYFISKEEILQYPQSLINRLFILLSLCFYTLFLLPSVFSRNRALYAFTLIEAAESAILLGILKKHNIKKLYYSCIFEKDSNICACILMNSGIHVTKNPSEDPLYFNNQVVVADTLAVCNAYQNEEITYYKDTMFVNDTVQWLPEQSLRYMSKYPDDSLAAPPATIGYYSGSSWVRIAYNFNLTKGKYDPYKAEFELIENLRAYLLEHPDITLTIFMHPIERRQDKIYEEAQAYYAEKFAGVNYKLAGRNTVTGMALEDVDVAIAVFSGAITYRIYAGYKGLFYTPYMPGYPVKGSSMDHICVNNKNDLFTKLDETIKFRREDYFKQYKLQSYTYNKPINQFICVES